MVRITEIAEKMNLSIATVSNAFTGKGRMKAETRAAILACAEEMGYQWKAQNVSDKKGTPVIIAENLTGVFTSSILSSILEEAEHIGITLPVFSLQFTDEVQLRNPDIEKLNQKVQSVLSSIHLNISGIIYISQYVRRMDGLLDSLNIPVVSVYCCREDGKPYVHYDDRQGAYLAVSTLLEEGRRKIAMVSGPIDSIGMYLRSAGYQQALMEKALPYDPRLVRIGDWAEESGYELTLELLKEFPDIDAVFAQNDFIAVGVLRAIRKMGLSVPENISVIGFDDSLPCYLSSPRLTSVKPPFAEMGKEALNRLLLLMGNTKVQRVSSNELLPCLLVRQESTLQN